MIKDTSTTLAGFKQQITGETKKAIVVSLPDRATDKNIKNITGKYFYQSKIKEPSIFAQSQKDADLLWDISLRIVKNKGLTLT